jgi:hypothetical protein
MERYLCAALLSFLFSEIAVAEEQTRVLESTRALGRGNTYVAAYDSDEATHLNPATLAEADKLTWQLRPAALDLFIGENAIDTIDDIMTKSSSEGSAVEFLEIFEDRFGKRQYARGQLILPSLRIFSFELSPFVSSTNYAEARLPSMPDVYFKADQYVGANISLALAADKALSYGLTVRPMHRTLYEGGIGFDSLIEFLDDSSLELGDVFQKKEGIYMGVDVGVIYAASKEWRLGATVENLGYAGNQGDFQNPAPAIPQRLNTGANYRVDYNPWHWDLSIDIQDVVNPNNYNYFRLLHLGTEFGRSYFTRDNDVGMLAGFNEGYFTTGAYLDFWLGRLGATYYAVEVGEFPGQRKDRRWAFTLQTAMTF